MQKCVPVASGGKAHPPPPLFLLWDHEDPDKRPRRGNSADRGSGAAARARISQFFDFEQTKVKADVGTYTRQDGPVTGFTVPCLSFDARGPLGDSLAFPSQKHHRKQCAVLQHQSALSICI